MSTMTDGLEKLSSGRLEGILERLTSNVFKGVLLGALVTGLIQSSAATTVMCVGFVNAGIMKLPQTVGIIMGANIGTTVTGLLIALDVGVLAPLFAFVGVVVLVFVKKPQLQHIGQIMAGLGVLFIGMDMMSSSMAPLRQSPGFVSLMSNFSNPLLGILFGALFTAVIQSSSASVGILQTLAAGGVIPFSSAVFVLFGQNIGTCITAVLASIGTTRAAQQACTAHVLFNVIGVCIFLPLMPLYIGLIAATSQSIGHQIANAHTLFNVCNTLLFLPFVRPFAALIRFLFCPQIWLLLYVKVGARTVGSISKPPKMREKRSIFG